MALMLGNNRLYCVIKLHEAEKLLLLLGLAEKLLLLLGLLAPPLEMCLTSEKCFLTFLGL